MHSTQSRSIDKFNCDLVSKGGGDVDEGVEREAGDAAAERIIDGGWPTLIITKCPSITKSKDQSPCPRSAIRAASSKPSSHLKTR